MSAFIPNWRSFDVDHSARLLSGTAGSGRVVAMVTTPSFAALSEAPGLALAVAGLWAQEGELVVLADGCLENPRLHTGLGPDSGDGLSDLLTGSRQLEDVALSGPVSRLKIVPAGGRAMLRDPGDVRERFGFICQEFKAHGVTFVLFASLGSDLGRWAVQECTDIVILGRETDNLTPFLAPDEDRVRAVIGPLPPPPEQLELVPPTAAPAPEPDADSAPALEETTPDADFAAALEPEATDPGFAPALDEAPPAADLAPALEEPTADASGSDHASLGFSDAPAEAEPSDDVLTPAVEEPEPRRSTVEWKDEADEPPPSRPTPPSKEETERPPWRSSGAAKDPWALAAAQLRAQGAPPRPDPPVIPRMPERSPREEASLQGVRWTVGPLLKRRSTLVGVAVIVAVALGVAFWPFGNGAGDTQFSGPSDTETASATPAAEVPATEGGAPETPAGSGGEEPAGAVPVTEVEETPPPAEAVSPPSTAEETAPHVRYSAGLAALGGLDDALQFAARIQRSASQHLLHVAPVEVNGTVYYRVLAGLVENFSDVAGVIGELAAATGQDGSRWIVRDAALAFAMGDFQDAAAAGSRAGELTGQGIPAYVLAIDHADGSSLYRVYAGAYANRTESTYLAGLIQDNGLSAALVERTGRPQR